MLGCIDREVNIYCASKRAEFVHKTWDHELLLNNKRVSKPSLCGTWEGTTHLSGDAAILKSPTLFIALCTHFFEMLVFEVGWYSNMPRAASALNGALILFNDLLHKPALTSPGRGKFVQSPKPASDSWAAEVGD